MLPAPITEPSERRLSEIDRFCLQTRLDAKAEAARHVRVVASTLGVFCLALAVCLGVAVWRGNALAQERDQLVEQLRTERAERIQASLAARDVEMNAAHYALDTRVRRDIVEERMQEQERRGAELEQRAQEIARQKLAEANCVTPRSIRVAADL
jgi:cell division protein FtsB